MNKYIVSILCCLALPATADDTGPALQACRQALEAGDYVLAASKADLVLKNSPNDREAYLCLGRARGRSGDHAAAVTALQKAEKLSSTPIEHIVALTLLGNQHKAVNAYPEAIAIYQQSLVIARSEKNKHFEMVNLNQIGESLQGGGDMNAALEHFQEALKLAANDNERADGNAHLAAAYSKLGKHDQAISYQVKSVVLEERSGDLEHNVNANVELGRIYIDAKQYAKAEKTLNKMLGIVKEAGGDDYWEARISFLLGKVQAGQGHAAEGIEFFNRGLELATKVGAEELIKEIETGKKALKM